MREGVRRTLRSRAFRILAGSVIALLLLWALRAPILRGIGAFLITEDAPCRVDAVYVLGGSAEMRGQEAAAVYRMGLSRRFLFTGAPVPKPLLVEGIHHTEAFQTRNMAVRSGLPDSLAVAMDLGTSTWEESMHILSDAKAQGFDTIMVVSSRFHLRRIGMVFRDRFREQGITVVLHGARNGPYDDARWWDDEEGLLMVNNEYVKLVYYLLKY